MPTYDYLCEDNGQVVQVRHPMSVVIRNWGVMALARLRRNEFDLALEAAATAVGEIGKASRTNYIAFPGFSAAAVSRAIRFTAASAAGAADGNATKPCGNDSKRADVTFTPAWRNCSA